MTILHEHPMWKYIVLVMLCGIAIWYATACVPNVTHAQQMPPIAAPIPPPIIVSPPPTVILVPGQLPIYIR